MFCIILQIKTPIKDSMSWTIRKGLGVGWDGFGIRWLNLNVARGRYDERKSELISLRPFFRVETFHLN